MPAIKTITLNMPLNLGSVNCYLVQAEDGFILIDTGVSNKRAQLEKELVLAGCQPGVLKLIVITHGDYDHTGNAAYLRTKFNTPIAMHAGDAGMAEDGDMFFNREAPNRLVKVLAPILFGFGKAKRFKPDIDLEDGFDFSTYGLNAKALSLPGHSAGSIGVLTGEGDLFCGDLLDNREKPALSTLMDKVEIGKASVQKLSGMPVNLIYPGHGKPFRLDELPLADETA
jgi:glyoxylase-like metal-dependent hydrolase (beta-lactamase superfamily II)